MAKMRPISWRELIRRLQRLGFAGPFPGTRHDCMRRPTDQVKVPVPRADAKSREIGVELQKRILRQIGASREEWMSLD
jgi:predicted RNA binding protein YcfA (HicA-like mRNA interferase family)